MNLPPILRAVVASSFWLDYVVQPWDATFSKLIEWLFDGLFERLIEWSLSWLIDWLIDRNGQCNDIGARSVRLPDAASHSTAGRGRLPGANVRNDGEMLGQAPGTATDLRLLERILWRLCNGNRGTIPAAGVKNTDSSAFISGLNCCSGLHSIDKFVVYLGCLQLPEMLEISWNLKFFLEVLELSRKLIGFPGKFSANRWQQMHSVVKI